MLARHYDSAAPITSMDAETVGPTGWVPRPRVTPTARQPPTTKILTPQGLQATRQPPSTSPRPGLPTQPAENGTSWQPAGPGVEPGPAAHLGGWRPPSRRRGAPDERPAPAPDAVRSLPPPARRAPALYRRPAGRRRLHPPGYRVPRGPRPRAHPWRGAGVGGHGVRLLHRARDDLGVPGPLIRRRRGRTPPARRRDRRHHPPLRWRLGCMRPLPRCDRGRRLELD